MAETGMRKTLNLTGVTVNAMALIAPGAFLWITFQVQAAQVDMAGKTTAMDMWSGLFFALILCFLTAISYAQLAEKYPEAGTGSSYYFTEQAFLGEKKLSPFARVSKMVVGWITHLYYWVYPGVMVAMFAVLVNYILGQFGVNLTPIMEILIAVVFCFACGYVAFRGINGSTTTSIIINIIQITALVFITVLALIYRFTNPQHVTFVHQSLASVVIPHSIANMFFQATIAILVLVGFETTTALAAEAQSPKHVSRGVLISLVIQGLICYLFEYFGANAWLSTAYTQTVNGATVSGIAAAAASGAPIGDMCKILGDSLLNHSGFILMIVVAITVIIAVFGTTLACMNTAVRVTYAMAQDGEVPSILNALHHHHATPHTAVWVLTVISAVIGAYGVLSITGLTAVTLLSNFGTFLVYGLTCIVTLIAFLRHPGRNPFTHIIVPALGVLANLGMLLAIIYMGILGGGMTQVASMIAIITTAAWFVVGIVYFLANSRSTGRKIVVNA